MSTTTGGRLRAALVTAAVLGTALSASVASASAASTGPERPDELFNSGFACSTDPAAPVFVAGNGLGVDRSVQIEGVPRDSDATDNPSLTAQYSIWPAGDPSQATTYSDADVSTGFEGPAYVPTAGLTEGQTYAWQARTVAGDESSHWTHACYFTLDTTAPSAAPTITSADYPTGQWDQGGAPIQVRLGSNGVDDVAGYAFAWQQTIPVPNLGGTGAYGIPQPANPWADTAHFVQATTLGGDASLELLPPAGSSGPLTLYVESLDRAFNVSAESSYQIMLSSTAPTITPPATAPAFGTPADFTFSPNAAVEAASPVVSYSVQIGGQAAQTYPAGPDGTATVPLTLDQAADNDVTVSSTSADGWVSDAATQSYYFDTTPTVSSDVYVENGTSGGVGVPGTFTFEPKVSGVVSYTYSFDWGATETTVAADANGAAQISWTPPQGDGAFYDLNVYATTANGTELSAYDYYFSVN